MSKNKLVYEDWNLPSVVNSHTIMNLGYYITENNKGKEEIITKSGKVWIEDGIIRSKVLFQGEYTLEHAMDDAKAFRMMAEKIEDKKLLNLGSRLSKGKELMNYLYRHPIVKINEIEKKLNITFPTATKLIEDFVNLNILNELTGFKRNRVFQFKDYIDLFK